MSVANAALVFVGGGLGAVLRYLATLVIGGPIATLAVNVAGGVAIGWLAGTLSQDASQMRLLLMTGVLGGFTTFSAFGLETITLWQRGEPVQAGVYVAASVVLSLAATVAGFAVSRFT